jgi:actin-like ATPase involved in cell morphogenesis
LRSGTPKEVNITEEDTAEALNDIMREMINSIKQALENTPPELSADLVDMGLTLTGGGALLKNIDKRFSKETGLPVHVAGRSFILCCLLALEKHWIKKKHSLLCYLNIKINGFQQR